MIGTYETDGTDGTAGAEARHYDRKGGEMWKGG